MHALFSKRRGLAMQAFNNYFAPSQQVSNYFPQDYNTLNKVIDRTIQTINCPSMATCFDTYANNVAAQVCRVCAAHVQKLYIACCGHTGMLPGSARA